MGPIAKAVKLAIDMEAEHLWSANVAEGAYRNHRSHVETVQAPDGFDHRGYASLVRFGRCERFRLVLIKRDNDTNHPILLWKFGDFEERRCGPRLGAGFRKGEPLRVAIDQLKV
jgi:hypothetical protein